jgi:K+-transporting ATPase A subunit
MPTPPPYENPSDLSNMLQVWSMLVVPVGRLCQTNFVGFPRLW